METSSDGKGSACHAADPDLIPGSGRPPGGGHSYPLQCSCLENPMARGAWRAAVHGVSKSQTGLMMSTVYIKNVGNLRDQRVQDVASPQPVLLPSLPLNTAWLLHSLKITLSTWTTQGYLFVKQSIALLVGTTFHHLVIWNYYLQNNHDCLVTKSCPTLVTLWTGARQAPTSMGFSRQEYWSGLPFPSLQNNHSSYCFTNHVL